MEELEEQAREWVAGKPLTQKIFGRQYIWNLFSHNSKMDVESGYNEEEVKMVKETAKIFNDTSMKVTATCVRVPVLRAHCESINLTFSGKMSVDRAREILSKAPGVQLMDDRLNNRFPEPLDASGLDPVMVGRLRDDPSQEGGVGLSMFVSGDQIRKGAALNAIQIAEIIQKDA